MPDLTRLEAVVGRLGERSLVRVDEHGLIGRDVDRTNSGGDARESLTEHDRMRRRDRPMPLEDANQSSNRPATSVRLPRVARAQGHDVLRVLMKSRKGRAEEGRLRVVSHTC